MKKGIVLEIDERYVTLLTPDGQFLRAHNFADQYKIGEEITFFPIEEPTREGKPLKKWLHGMNRKVILATMVMLVMLVGTIVPMFEQNQVYAYMTIDNQSSLELAVNEELEVIEIIPNNKAGEAVLEKLDDWENEDLKVVSKSIIEEMDAQGYIQQKEIILSTVYKEKRDNKTDLILQNDITELKQLVATKNKTIKEVKGSMKDRKEARKRGLSVGEFKEEAKEKENNQQKQKQMDKKQPAAKQPIKEQQGAPSDTQTNEAKPENPNTLDQIDKQNGQKNEPNKQNKQPKQQINSSDIRQLKETTNEQVLTGNKKDEKDQKNKDKK